MSLEGPPLGNNRFSLLSPSPQPKRKKAKSVTTEFFPSLPTVKKDNPKYLVVSAVDTNKPLKKYSCFAVHKALQNISSEPMKITDLKDGNLLLMVKNSNIAKKFLATKHLNGICKVNIDLHNTLNYSKGTIYAPCLNEIPESEIVENLKDHGVVSVYKFQKYNEGKSFPSGVVLLTFDSYYLPEKIDVSWYTTKVRAYYSNPMRCKSCQLLGHTAKRCQKTPACDMCALPPHLPVPCTRIFCVNCAGNHSASSKLCPKYKQMKEIIVIKTDNKCSMREAIRIHKLQIPPQLNEYSTSFSTVIKDSLISSPLTTAATNNILNIQQQNNTKTSRLLPSVSNNIPNNQQQSDKQSSSPPLSIAEKCISSNQQQNNTNLFSTSLSIVTNNKKNNQHSFNTNNIASLNADSNSHTNISPNLSNQTIAPINSVDDLNNLKSSSYDISTLNKISQSD